MDISSSSGIKVSPFDQQEGREYVRSRKRVPVEERKSDLYEEIHGGLCGVRATVGL